MEIKLLTGAELARHCGVTRQAVFDSEKKGRLFKDPVTGRYDPNHSTNIAYISRCRSKIDARGETTLSVESESEGELYLEKIKADIKYKNKQSRKLDLQFEIEKKNLVPFELIGLWMGAFATGIRNNFLQIGNRVARGDTKLRNRIEKEVTKSIKKTLENAAAQLRQETEKIIELMEEKTDD